MLDYKEKFVAFTVIVKLHICFILYCILSWCFLWCLLSVDDYNARIRNVGIILLENDDASRRRKLLKADCLSLNGNKLLSLCMIIETLQFLKLIDKELGGFELCKWFALFEKRSFTIFSFGKRICGFSFK